MSVNIFQQAGVQVPADVQLQPHAGASHGRLLRPRSQRRPERAVDSCLQDRIHAPARRSALWTIYITFSLHSALQNTILYRFQNVLDCHVPFGELIRNDHFTDDLRPKTGKQPKSVKSYDEVRLCSSLTIR